MWFKVKMACLCVLINTVSFVYSSIFSWKREILLLSSYNISSLNMLCEFLKFLLVYSITEMFISQLSFGRVYGR